MKLKRNKKIVLLSLCSGLVLSVFIFLALGSVLMPFERILSFAFYYSRSFKQTGEYVSAIDFKTEEIAVYEGYEDKHGRWHGMVREDIFSIAEGGQVYELKGRWRHGKRHGITELIVFKDNKPHSRSIWYYEDGKVKWVKIGDLLKKSAHEMYDAYGYFHSQFPEDECLLHAIGYDSLYLKDFFGSLEIELHQEPFDPEKFDDRYEIAIEALEETPYDSIINDSEAFTLLNAIQILKHHPFRLAVIDRYLEQVSNSMEVLESRYTGFISDLEEADIGREDLSEFCRQFDSCMASYGNLDLEDPFLIDSIDSRIYQALFAIYEAGEEETDAILKAAMEPALTGMSGMRRMRCQIASGLEKAIESADAPEVAEVILYTIFISFLEGDMIKKSVWEAWVRQNGITVMPQVGTGDPTGQSTTSVSLGGYLFFDGGEPLSSMGIAWGTAYDPTIDMNSRSSSMIEDSFNVVISGLQEGKLYFARAFATNSVGTAYGSCISFKVGEVSDVYAAGSEYDGLRIYPNPSSGYTNLSFNLRNEAGVEIGIYEMDGRELYHYYHGFLNSGQNVLTMDFRGIKEGVYILQLQGEGAILYQQKLVITR